MPPRTLSRPASPLRQRLRDAAGEAVLDAAERVMVAKGYEQATMGEIAATAGCATGTLYLHFRNKEDLFRAIIARHARSIFAAACAAAGQGREATDRLRRAYGAILEYGCRHRAFFRLFFTVMPMRHRGMEQKLSGRIGLEQEEFDRLELSLLQQAQKLGLVRKDFTAEMLQKYIGAVALSMAEHFAFAPERLGPDEQLRILWGLVSGGIGAGRSGHGKA